MDKMDQLDQLLFDAAKARTDEMRFDIAFDVVQAAYQKKQRRRAAIRRGTSMAAMLVVGLFVGLMAGRAGLLDGRILASQTPSPAVTPAMEATPEPMSTPGGIVLDPPEQTDQGAEAQVGDIIVDPPTDEVTVPPNDNADPAKTDDTIDPPKTDEIVDAPKTDGIAEPPKTDHGDPEVPYEIEIDPPKTDAYEVVWFGNVQRFSNFPAQMPTGFDMTGFMPGWLPDGFDEPVVFGSGWSSQITGGEAWSYIFVCFQTERDLPDGMVSGLKIGEGRPQLKSYDGDAPAQSVDWAIRIDEENYFYMEFINVSFEDTVRVIERINS